MKSFAQADINEKVNKILNNIIIQIKLFLIFFFLSKKVDPAILYRQNDRVYKRVGLWPYKMLPIVIGNQHMHITSNSSRENIITE